MRVLDTDVCIEILRGNHRVIERRGVVADEVATTWITACELHYGAAKSRDPAHNQQLVVSFLATLPILGLNLDASNRFGQIKAELEAQGQRLADADLFIAATSLAHGAVLTSGNQKHYQRIRNLALEDWIRG